MRKIDTAKHLVEKFKQYREEERTIYDQFVETSRAHNMSIRVGDTVLYVEDDPGSITMFKSLLEFACHGNSCERMQVVPARSAAEAKRFIESNYLALKCVVLDLNLVEGDGEALLDWIVNVYRKSLPVIVYSGDTSRIDDIRNKYDFVEILVKGSTSDVDLVKAVQAHRGCGEADKCELPTCTNCKRENEEG
jgi:CheY-like chemotaxis protein